MTELVLKINRPEDRSHRPAHCGFEVQMHERRNAVMRVVGVNPALELPANPFFHDAATRNPVHQTEDRRLILHLNEDQRHEAKLSVIALMFHLQVQLALALYKVDDPPVEFKHGREVVTHHVQSFGTSHFFPLMLRPNHRGQAKELSWF